MCFRKFAPAADDRAADLLAQKCWAIDPAATDDEIAHFMEIKAAQATGSRRIENMVGFLIWSVPRCFGGHMIAEYRETVLALRETTSPQDETITGWLEVLNDPNETTALKDRARQELARLAVPA